MGRRWGGGRRGRQGRRVVLPAPLDPMSATGRPGCALSAASSSRVPARAERAQSRATGSYRGAGEPQATHGEQQDEAHDGKYDRKRDGAIRVALEGEVDGGGHGLGPALQVAGDGDG